LDKMVKNLGFENIGSFGGDALAPLVGI
jgi:hypothetical protein